MQISVVLPAFNAAETIGRQLSALTEQDFDGQYEIIVANNRSTDATKEVIDGFAARDVRVRTVTADRAQGVNAGRNAGISASSAPLIAIADADDEVEPGWLRAIAHGLEEFDCVAGVLVPSGPTTSWRRVSEELEPKHGFMPAPTGANCGLRRSVWKAVDGFDESFPGGNTDTEFFWRTQLAGFSLGLVREARVRHHVRATFEADCARRRRYASEDARLFRKFKAHGMRRSSTKEAARQWAWLGRHIVWARLGHPRAKHWRWVMCLRIGRIEGSLRHRTLFL